jgi:alpha-L-rhamnosidase
MESSFSPGRWIWSDAPGPNPYVAFVKTVSLTHRNRPVHVRITASSHYELFLNGDFVGRGPVYGDPQWCLYDEWVYTPSAERDRLEIVIVAHHSTGTRILAVKPAPAGVLALFTGKELECGTDGSWKCLPLPMWRQDVPERGWALDYCEDYDAAHEPSGWDRKIFDAQAIAGCQNAVLVPDPDTIWSGYQSRPTPYLQHRFVAPVRFSTYRAPGEGAAGVGEVSRYCDAETLLPVRQNLGFDLDAVNAHVDGENAYTFDLGSEYIGYYEFEIEAPEGRILDVSGAELLLEGRPSILRKGTRFSLRYHTGAGQRRFRSFAWSGFRYLHLVIRGGADDVTIHRVGCLERSVPLHLTAQFPSEDETLQQIFALCRRTLEVGVQEHLIDCPTREQAQYWGDALFIAQSLWQGFGEPRYLEWYLDCFLHVPFNAAGQISSVYPGEHAVFLDYSLIPLLGQRFFHQNTGHFYKVQESCEKALALKTWYDARRNEDGLVQAVAQETVDGIAFINFIDHPGLGWHDFPHRGIDRDGLSCPLNLFYLGFLQTLADMLTEAGSSQSAEVQQQAERLSATLIAQFFDGTVFHDARQADHLSDGTSWHTNALAVYFDLVRGEAATQVMQTMLDRYETVCRCSPYFYFYFLPTLRKIGLEAEALALIKKEWQPMLTGTATTTWEGFAGDEKDTMCHPWSTAPFLHLITAP